MCCEINFFHTVNKIPLSLFHEKIILLINFSKKLLVCWTEFIMDLVEDITLYPETNFSWMVRKIPLLILGKWGKWQVDFDNFVLDKTFLISNFLWWWNEEIKVTVEKSGFFYMMEHRSWGFCGSPWNKIKIIITWVIHISLHKI